MRTTASFAAVATLLALSSTAAARPKGFVEGTVGWSYAMADAGYLEERQGPVGQAGVRAGVLWRDTPRRQWGFELSFDRSASFQARYQYYVHAEDGITVDPHAIRPEYDRSRILLSGRMQI